MLGARPIDRLSPRQVLTTVPSRDLVREQLEHGLRRAARDERALALLMIYVEGIGALNRDLGAAAADAALVTVAQRLTALLRDTDTVGRFGGAKFAVVLAAMAAPADVQPVADRMLAAVAEPVPLGLVTARLSCSVGVALFPSSADTADELIRRATVAMGKVKDEGGSGLRFG